MPSPDGTCIIVLTQGTETPGVSAASYSQSHCLMRKTHLVKRSWSVSQFVGFPLQSGVKVDLRAQQHADETGSPC